MKEQNKTSKELSEVEIGNLLNRVQGNDHKVVQRTQEKIG